MYFRRVGQPKVETVRLALKTWTNAKKTDIPARLIHRSSVETPEDRLLVETVQKVNISNIN